MMVTINIWRGSGIVRFGVSPEFKDQPGYLQNQMTLYVSSHIQTRAGEIALEEAFAQLWQSECNSRISQSGEKEPVPGDGPLTSSYEHGTHTRRFMQVLLL